MQGISFKAVILGFLAMFALDILIGIVLFGFFAEGLTPEMSEQEIETVIAGLKENGAYMLCGAAFGTLTTVIGGYVAARIATSLPYKNAFALGLLGILIGSFMVEDMPLWYNALWIVSTLPAALFGAHIAKRQMNK